MSPAMTTTTTTTTAATTTTYSFPHGGVTVMAGVPGATANLARYKTPTRSDSLAGPPRSSYDQPTPRAFFTFAAGHSGFQIGRLGIEASCVAGTLHLRFPKDRPLRAKRITLQLNGTERVQWTTDEHGRQVTHRSWRVWANTSRALWSAPEYRKLTALDLPFRMALAPDLPSTSDVMSGAGTIEYYLTAVIRSKASTWLPCRHGLDKEIRVACPIRRYERRLTAPPSETVPPWRAFNDPRAIAAGLRYDVALPSICFAPGEEVAIPVRVAIADFEEVLVDISASIKEYRQLHSGARMIGDKRCLVRENVLGMHLPSLYTALGREFHSELILRVPCENPRPGDPENDWRFETKQTKSNEACTCTMNGPCVSVTHKIKVCIRFRSGREVRLERVCSIANFVTATNAHDQDDDESSGTCGDGATLVENSVQTVFVTPPSLNKNVISTTVAV